MEHKVKLKKSNVLRQDKKGIYNIYKIEEYRKKYFPLYSGLDFDQKNILYQLFHFIDFAEYYSNARYWENVKEL